jgi:hypothetical protein
MNQAKTGFRKLLGLHELRTATGSPGADALFEESVAGLVALLPAYDAGWWSLYSLRRHPRPDLAKPFYQRLHPVMLKAMHLVTGDVRFLAMAHRWEAQMTPAALARVCANKVAFRASRVRAGRG